MKGVENALFQAIFVISFWQIQASSDGATRIYAQPKMVKNGQMAGCENQQEAWKWKFSKMVF